MNPGERPVFVLFGDSITKYGSRMANGGWVFLLDDLYDGRVDILNRGHSGYNTRWAKLLFPRYFPEIPTTKRKSVVTIFLGANDSVLSGERQHVPLDEYKQNLLDLIESIQNPAGAPSQSDLRTIIVITPPPIDAPVWGRHAGRFTPETLDRCNENTKKYANAAIEAANESNGRHGVAVHSINLYVQMMESKEPWADYLVDGLHLTKSGNKFLFDAILHVLSSIPDYDPAKMAWDYPHHAAVDAKAPENSFNVHTQ
eukprot:TRINITY_DN11857_c0_g1_i1.p1 TRINITY_DN11857_c0_g1~~TRINITY_DN11857_c0_g1_i1.p1  ORF type:complete len:256 (-),score=58.88 TRINITY_DN11857_c0_g1_i1:16-783(-)